MADQNQQSSRSAWRNKKAQDPSTGCRYFHHPRALPRFATALSQGALLWLAASARQSALAQSPDAPGRPAHLPAAKPAAASAPVLHGLRKTSAGPHWQAAPAPPPMTTVSPSLMAKHASAPVRILRNWRQRPPLPVARKNRGPVSSCGHSMTGFGRKTTSSAPRRPQKRAHRFSRRPLLIN